MQNLATTLSPAASATAPLPLNALQPLELAELRGYAFTYTFRGLVVMTAALSNYGLEHTGFVAPWLPWMVLMPMAAIVQTIRGRRQRKLHPASTSATAKLMRLLQKSFLLTLLLAFAAASQIGWESMHPLILIAYGLVTVAAGRVLHFRPLLIGGLICGLLGAVATAVAADTQLLVIAAAMLVSYVVPGYLLGAQCRASVK